MLLNVKNDELIHSIDWNRCRCNKISIVHVQKKNTTKKKVEETGPTGPVVIILIASE